MEPTSNLSERRIFRERDIFRERPSVGHDLEATTTRLRDARERYIFQGGSDYAVNLADKIDRLQVSNTVLQNDLNTALNMLAGWCLAASLHGDVSDSHAWAPYYHQAMFKDGPLRAMLDKAMAALPPMETD